ncbi:MAG: hypothetical protein ACE5FU_01140 [Nitrospinota bacterium]
MDKKLSLYKRLGVKIHLTLCHACTRYKHQLKALIILCRTFGEGAKTFMNESTVEKLTKETKERIAKALRKKSI